MRPPFVKKKVGKEVIDAIATLQNRFISTSPYRSRPASRAVPRFIGNVFWVDRRFCTEKMERLRARLATEKFASQVTVAAVVLEYWIGIGEREQLFSSLVSKIQEPVNTHGTRRAFPA